MTAEELQNLRPGDELLVSAPGRKFGYTITQIACERLSNGKVCAELMGTTNGEANAIVLYSETPGEERPFPITAEVVVRRARITG